MSVYVMLTLFTDIYVMSATDATVWIGNDWNRNTFLSFYRILLFFIFWFLLFFSRNFFFRVFDAIFIFFNYRHKEWPFNSTPPHPPLQLSHILECFYLWKTGLETLSYPQTSHPTPETAQNLRIIRQPILCHVMHISSKRVRKIPSWKVFNTEDRS